VETRYDELIERLRVAAQPDRPQPAAMASYLDTVRLAAYRVTDADIDGLRADGFSEDAIFEHTVSTAVAAGLVRLDAGLRALE
jgi:alkylhydroperoxidase family enzyme